MDVINTHRLKLRPYKLTDINSVHEYASDEKIVKYMLFGPNTHQETEAFVNKIINEYYKETPVKHFEYAIELNGLMVGGVSIHIDHEKKEGEVGWILNPKFHRQGIMSEAAIALVQYAIKQFNLTKIFAKCDSRNEASQGAMRKLGMHQIGVEENARIDKKSGVYEFHNLVFQVEVQKNNI